MTPSTQPRHQLVAVAAAVIAHSMISVTVWANDRSGYVDVGPSPADTTWQWPAVDEVMGVLLLRDYNTRLVVLSTVVLGAAGGLVGVFLLLRKRSLMGDALSHATLPGIGVAFMVMAALGGDGKWLPGLLAGAAVSGLAGGGGGADDDQDHAPRRRHGHGRGAVRREFLLSAANRSRRPSGPRDLRSKGDAARRLQGGEPGRARCNAGWRRAVDIARADGRDHPDRRQVSRFHRTARPGSKCRLSAGERRAARQTLPGCDAPLPRLLFAADRRVPVQKIRAGGNRRQTGYGMASFTLLGSRVIRFSLHLNTSYPHEILHNWWATASTSTCSRGNWPEGLTAYLADHLLLDVQGQGRAVPLSELMKYLNYVHAENDFPLSAFTHRTDMASQAIGYARPSWCCTC